MKAIYIFIVVLFLGINTYAQQTNLLGSWLMVKAEKGGEVEEPFVVLEFAENGKIITMGIEVASWAFDKKSNTLKMESKFEDEFSGDYSIHKFDENILVIEKDGITFSYEKLDMGKIYSDNEKSDLFGIWEFKFEEGKTSILQLSKPDEFLEIGKEYGMEEKFRGTWMFIKKEHSILFMGMSETFDGKVKLKHVDNEKLVLIIDGTEFVGKKQVQSNIERLEFTEDEFSGENNAALPWTTFFDDLEKMQNLTLLKYRFGKLMPDVNQIHWETVIKKVKINLEKESLVFTNIIIDHGDSSQFSQNVKGQLENSYNFFFPEEEPDYYRFVGIETITVPAGTFECTVIEGFQYETKFKFWMINEKPFVYAKSIKEKIGPFDEIDYTIMELEELK